MLNIHDLERRWIRYKIKSYLPLLLLSFTFIVGIVVYIFFIPSFVQKENLFKDANGTKSSFNNKKIKQPTQKEKVAKRTPQISSTKLSPSMNFMNNFQHNTTKMEERVTRQTKEQSSNAMIQTTQNRETREIRRFQASNIIITKQETKNDIQNILKRFQKERSPALSLFLAKRYYEGKKYKMAYKYALITNQLNQNIEDSWLIFAKTLVKLHHKKRAIDILKKYIQNTGSTQASILLENIQSGAFH